MFQIAWMDAAFDGLANLCLLHQDRWDDINSAVDIIEYRLQRNPLTHSGEVSEGLRRIDLRPVAVCFSISGTTVTIESIGWIG
jgi:hypothetical protein